MNFLGLTPLQTGLLAATTAGIVIGLYLLKLRRPRVLISSSFLWSRVLDERGTYSRREKLRKLISVAIALTISWLIALAIARPQIAKLTGRNQRVVIVLDTSPTMLTKTSDGKTRWQHAVTEAKRVLDAGDFTTEFRALDTSEFIVSAFTTDRNEVRKLIDEMSPKIADPRFPIVYGQSAEVYFISDGVTVRGTPSSVRRISVYEPANNVGITAFGIRTLRSDPLHYEAYLEIQDFGQPTETNITLSGISGQHINRTVRLGSGEIYKEVFDLSQFSGGGIRVQVGAKDDAFSLDDIAFGYLPIKRKLKTLLVTKNNSALETLLKLDQSVDLRVIDPSNYKETLDVDAYIFDGFAPSTAPPRPTLIVGAAGAPWLKPARGQVRNPELTTWSESHPVMQQVSIPDLHIEQATQIDAGALTVLAASKETPLIVASEKPKWVMLTFDLTSSDFALQSGFPVFVENVLEWFGGNRSAISRSPGFVEVPLANAEIRTLDGKTVASDQQLGRTVFQAAEPGLYVAKQEDESLYIAVNLTKPIFSDVNRSVFKTDRGVATPTHWPRHELWFYMLLAAIALVSVEWFTYHRRVTL